MSANPAFTEVFHKLKKLLQPYESHLILKHNTQEAYYLNTSINPIKPNEEGFFGAAQIKKNYVSFYLFPVYMFPELLEGISDELAKRMQGKSCFNFKKSDDALLQQLQELTNRGFAKLQKENLL